MTSHSGQGEADNGCFYRARLGHVSEGSLPLLPKIPLKYSSSGPFGTIAPVFLKRLLRASVTLARMMMLHFRHSPLLQ
jgi:hypothetical protein